MSISIIFSCSEKETINLSVYLLYKSPFNSFSKELSIINPWLSLEKEKQTMLP
jgi:hypothetical protein